MEFRLLGLFEVSEDGRMVELPRGKERALLAVLLLHANEPVSVDRLVEELWGERPPENATKAVQVYISRLRKTVGAERLRTTPGGYVVDAAPSELDSARFEQLAQQGQGALACGLPEDAERLLSEALALWRGPALADFRFESFAQPELRRLDELRNQAVADRIESRLEQGRTGSVIAELEELVEQNPLWERPRRQLMLALYQAGRQADALELYRKTRALLADELGIEPSPELQALERAILNQDESLARPEPLARGAVRRRGGKLLVAGGLVTLAAAVTTAVMVARSGSNGISTLAPDTVGVVDAGSGRITAQLRLAGRPTRLAAAAGSSVWIGDDQAGTLSSVGLRADAVGRIVSTSAFPSDVAFGEGAVWVLDGQSGLLTKIDPNYGSVHRTRVAARNTVSYDRSRESLDPTAVAAGLGSVWTTDGSNRLTQVNPTTLKVVRRLNLGAPLDDVAVGEGAVWAISGRGAIVLHLDRDGHETWRLPIASKPGVETPYPIDVAVGAGSVWVLNANTATVTKIDPTQRAVAGITQLGIERRPAHVAAGDGSAWVADGDGTLARIDAAGGAPDLLPEAEALRDVAVVGKSVWVTAGAGAGTASSPSATAGRLQPLPTSFCSPVYSGSGERPQFLVVGDLAFQGTGGTLAAQAGEAIQLILKQHGFRAGRFVLGYQSCDNSSAADGYPTAAKCAANARAYVGDPAILGLIGSWSSSCSEVQLPITNRAPAGPLAMISPNNSYVGLTHHGPGTTQDEPAKYYPTGVRSYVRVSAADDAQGAADALVARRLGAHTVLALRDNEPYGDGIASDFAKAARRLGLTVLGPSLWNYQATSYQPFVSQVVRGRPDAVFLGTFFGTQTIQLIKDLRNALPPSTLLIAPDGFDPASLIASAGVAAERIAVSALGRPPEQLPAAGRRFVDDFKRATGNPTLAAPTIAAAQATEVLLAAIAHSNGTRASVVKQLFRTRITNGILGSFSFDHNGDTTARAITIYRITHGSPTILTVITPTAALLH